jgi:hypothetical protein
MGRITKKQVITTEKVKIFDKVTHMAFYTNMIHFTSKTGTVE